MRIENGDTLLFATRNRNKIALYARLFAEAGLDITLIGLDEAEHLLSAAGKPGSLRLPDEADVAANGNYSGNSAQKARAVAGQVRGCGLPTLENAKVIADDWGMELRALCWAVRPASAEKTVCLRTDAPPGCALHPFPGLDTRPYVNGFARETDGLLDPTAHDLQLHARAAEAMHGVLGPHASRAADYVNILTVTDLKTGEAVQYEGRAHGTFCYPPESGEYGFGFDMCIRPEGRHSTLSRIPPQEALRFTAEADAVAKATGRVPSGRVVRVQDIAAQHPGRSAS